MTEQQPAQGGVMPAVVASIETTGPQQAVDDPTPGLHRVSLWRPHISRRDWLRTALYAGLIVVVGLLAGLVWYLVAPLQSVTVTSDGTVTTTNTAAVQNFGPDAAFIMIGLVAGLVLGICAWQWFKGAGWPVVLFAVLGAGLCALVAVSFASVIGPHDFDERLAGAAAGETVMRDLALTTPTAWVVWPFAAVVPVLVYSSLTHDTDDPRVRERLAADEEPADGTEQEQLPRWSEEGRTGSGHRLLRFSRWTRIGGDRGGTGAGSG
ncbi:hypothetical protein [Propionibacterium acidifaciens]|uniref:hypothetical protein n=1 Tax=Propionibacterium acidifaciens TaxID=556499 RepID=UPI0028E5D83D|nr:hypothetical protein [Propionibacterium acidifaciens]